MLPSDEFALIYKKQMLITEEEVYNLFAEFLKVSPVATGAFRSAWSISQNDNDSWTISNDVEYATILFDGRGPVGGTMRGSEQWQEGGDVMLEIFNRTLNNRLGRV